MNLTCKRGCGETGFNGPSRLHQHYVEKHGAPARKKNRRRKRADVVEFVSIPAPDAEALLIARSTDLFVNAETDQAGDERVLRYLNSRFGPEAYSDVDAGVKGSDVVDSDVEG